MPPASTNTLLTVLIDMSATRETAWKIPARAWKESGPQTASGDRSARPTSTPTSSRSRQPFRAKDFRTWGRTMLAALALGACEDRETEAAAKRNVTRAIEQVPAQLGNTVAVCRKSYHPEVVEAYLDATLLRHLGRRPP